MLLFATVSLTLGFVALFRIKRSGRTGRPAAVAGIGFGLLYYVLILVAIVRDLQPLFEPAALHP